MKKSELKKIIRECVSELNEWKGPKHEPWMDSFADFAKDNMNTWWPDLFKKPNGALLKKLAAKKFPKIAKYSDKEVYQIYLNYEPQ